MTLSTEIKDLYDAGQISTRQMIRFQLGSGVYGFIARAEELVYAGLTYKPFGLIEVSDISSGSGTTASGNFALTLAERSGDGLTPEVLMQIEDEDYRDRPVTVSDAHFHPETGALIQVEIVARGYIDVISHDADPDEGFKLIAQCEGRQLDYSRKNGRYRSVADQRRRSANDKIFAHAAKAGREEVFWGRKAGKT